MIDLLTFTSFISRFPPHLQVFFQVAVWVFVLSFLIGIVKLVLGLIPFL